MSKSHFINHKDRVGSSRITKIESRLDKKARKGKLIPECYICGTYDNLVCKSGFYVCVDCNNHENIFDNDSEE